MKIFDKLFVPDAVCGQGGCCKCKYCPPKPDKRFGCNMIPAPQNFTYEEPKVPFFVPRIIRNRINKNGCRATNFLNTYIKLITLAALNGDFTPVQDVLPSDMSFDLFFPSQ